MRNFFRTILLVCLCALAPAGASAQSSTSTGAAAGDGWRVGIYPILVWVPSGIDINVNFPPGDGDGGFAGEIIESRVDGAYLGGLSLEKGGWRIDADGIWAGVGGDRLELPSLTVDADVIYFHVSGGRRIVKDLYLTAGVRRLALKYNVEVEGFPNFERKPGLWDPLIGLGWHTIGRKFEFHVVAEGGGFGVGTDVEFAGSVRADWKPFTHFGLTGGYAWIYFEVEDTVANRPFIVKQTLQGPIVGVGIYF